MLEELSDRALVSCGPVRGLINKSMGLTGREQECAPTSKPKPHYCLGPGFNAWLWFAAGSGMPVLWWYPLIIDMRLCV